ncbi:MAG: hypothetical protein Q9224_006080, partial [Gallowayella concinna]
RWLVKVRTELSLKESDRAEAHKAVFDSIKIILKTEAEVEKSIAEAKERTDMAPGLVNRHQIKLLDNYCGTSWKDSGAYLEDTFGIWFFNEWWSQKFLEYQPEPTETEKLENMAELGINTFLKEEWFGAKDCDKYPLLRPMVQLRRAQLFEKEDKNEIKHFKRHLRNIVGQVGVLPALLAWKY